MRSRSAATTAVVAAAGAVPEPRRPEAPLEGLPGRLLQCDASPIFRAHSPGPAFWRALFLSNEPWGFQRMRSIRLTGVAAAVVAAMGVAGHAEAAGNSDRVLAALEAGQADFINNVPIHEVARLKRHPRVRIDQLEGLRMFFLTMNVAHKPFDNKLVRQAVKVGGIHGLALTKLDVLDGVAPLRICTAYRHFGQTLHHLPGSPQAQAGVEPLYEELDGWQESTRGARSFADLPAALGIGSV